MKTKRFSFSLAFLIETSNEFVYYTWKGEKNGAQMTEMSLEKQPRF